MRGTTLIKIDQPRFAAAPVSCLGFTSHLLERILVSYVIDEHSAVAVTVVDGPQCMEALLSSRVLNSDDVEG